MFPDRTVVGADSNIYFRNGIINMYWNGRRFVLIEYAKPVSQLGFGSDSTIAGIIGAATASGGGLTIAGELTASSRAVLNSALSSEQGDPSVYKSGRYSANTDQGIRYWLTAECYRAASAVLITRAVIAGSGNFNQFGFLTGWKRVGNSNPDPARFFQLGQIGRTVLYGVYAP
jgi:hypothetical protein